MPSGGRVPGRNGDVRERRVSGCERSGRGQCVQYEHGVLAGGCGGRVLLECKLRGTRELWIELHELRRLELRGIRQRFVNASERPSR